jgi:HK97 family phage major capsid protein
MVLYIGQKMQLLKRAHQREQHINEMQEILTAAKKENRAFTDDENKKFEDLEKKAQNISAELEKNNTSLEELMTDMEERNAKIEAIKNPGKQQDEKRAAKKRSENPLEVRGYIREERIGQHETDVEIGDLVYSHITGKFKNSEVRAALSTTSGGLIIPQGVYSDFIDKLRDNSILGEVTTYAMDSKTLAIPRVISDIVPEFKAENDSIITESSPVFDSVILEAKPLYAICPISLELIEASNLDMGSVITQLMASAMGDAMQKFMLNGAFNGYEGILNAGIGYSTAGDMGYAKIGEAMTVVKIRNGVPNSIVMNSTDAMDLQLLTDTTGQYIRQPEFMNELKRFELSEALPQGTAIIGDLSAIAFGILSSGGLQIEISRTAGEAFKKGQVVIRARLNGDFQVTNSGLLAKVMPVA